MMKQTIKRALSLVTALSLLLGLLAGCSSKAEAATMHLKRTEGTVDVSDDEGRNLEPAKNLGLYSGYGVDTRAASYAWIDLDEVKLTKMDENSQVEIKKEGRCLTIEVKSGSLFFNITEPLAEDETLDIRTSTMVVGIRGTCGWVEAPDGEHMNVYLLEGKVECTAGENTTTVNAGEMVEMSADGMIEVSAFSVNAVPAFVREEVEDDDNLIEAILDASGIDIAMVSLKDYKSALDELKKEGRILYTEIVDFEADGNPELLVLHTREYREEINDELLAYSIFRKGSDGIDKLLFDRMPLREGSSNSKLSLVESDGRMYLEECQPISYGDGNGNVIYYSYSYSGSIAEKDGANPNWSGGGRDWLMLYWISELHNDGNTKYSVHADFEGGGYRDEEARYHEIRGKFSSVKVLAYSPDGKTLIIAPDPSEIEDITPADADAGQEDQPSNAEILEQYKAIVAEGKSYTYRSDADLHANDKDTSYITYKYTLYQESGYSVPTLILENRGLDRHGYLLFRYDPATGTTGQVGDDTVTRFENARHSFLNYSVIPWENWHDITDTSFLESWLS